MAKVEYLIELDLGPNNGSLKFLNLEDIESFIQNERQEFAWMNAPAINQEISNLNSIIHSRTKAIIDQVTQIKSNPNHPLSALKNSFENAFITNRLPLSTSKVGIFINDLKSESEITAAAAYATWTNQDIAQPNNFDVNKGKVLIVAFDCNITNKTPASVKTALSNLEVKFQNNNALIEKERLAQQLNFDKQQHQTRKSLASMITTLRKRYRIFRARENVKINAAVSKFQETESLYKEHMRLKAPADYWSEKAKTHEENANILKLKLIDFAVYGGLVLLLFLLILFYFAVDIASEDKPTPLYFILASVGIAFTTVLFWSGRIFVRLFFSQHHLSIDAEERAIMAQTYLALTAEGTAGEKERAIVLASLFRPTADGIVKDDAAPEFSPASLISRIDSRP